MQNMNLPHFSQLGLPVPFHGVDQNTFNGNLPAMNDKVPPVQLSQLMMQNQQAVYQVIAKFRLNAQMAVNKGYLQMFCYNLLSQNGFQNPVYQQWAQTAVDFFEFLVVGKGYQPQQAIDMAAQRVMEAFIGMAFATYQQGLSQLVEPSRIPSLQTAVQIYHQITADIQRFKSGGGMAMNMGGAPMGGVSMGTQLPPISTVGGTPMGGLSNFATSSAPAFSSPLHSMSNNTPAATNTNNTGSAFYDDPPPSETSSTCRGMGFW
ncbi:hypothetical protein AVT69_gp138 [Pseudomonas phage PhiPA3]|uniref:Uncharacterized protein 140 n=1 Tax=Pseudomonas phage PhiPA3 TaxID=998086 RepID=F8SK13_BPPA3|nr:hypothetical protein AVT69_gp138 [Pseudomonas phage PhiPA3]AEH03563.1 hypothetical protein [Pseudomonas phage PhiPA3]